MLALLTFQKEEEICFYFFSWDGHLSLPWKIDLQQPGLEGMEEEFLAFQLENISQTLRLCDIYPRGGNTYLLESFRCNTNS